MILPVLAWSIEVHNGFIWLLGAMPVSQGTIEKLLGRDGIQAEFRPYIKLVSAKDLRKVRASNCCFPSVRLAFRGQHEPHHHWFVAGSKRVTAVRDQHASAAQETRSGTVGGHACHVGPISGHATAVRRHACDSGLWPRGPQATFVWKPNMHLGTGTTLATAVWDLACSCDRGPRMIMRRSAYRCGP